MILSLICAGVLMPPPWAAKAIEVPVGNISDKMAVVSEEGNCIYSSARSDFTVEHIGHKAVEYSLYSVPGDVGGYRIVDLAGFQKWRRAKRIQAEEEDYRVAIDRICIAGEMQGQWVTYHKPWKEGDRDESYTGLISGEPPEGRQYGSLDGAYVRAIHLTEEPRGYAFLGILQLPKQTHFLVKCGTVRQGAIEWGLPTGDPFAIFDGLRVDLSSGEAANQFYFSVAEKQVLCLTHNTSNGLWKSAYRINLPDKTKVKVPVPAGYEGLFPCNIGGRIYLNASKVWDGTRDLFEPPSRLFLWEKSAWRDLGPYSLETGSASGNWLLVRSAANRSLGWIAQPQFNTK